MNLDANFYRKSLRLDDKDDGNRVLTKEEKAEIREKMMKLKKGVKKDEGKLATIEMSIEEREEKFVKNLQGLLSLWLKETSPTEKQNFIESLLPLMLTQVFVEASGNESYPCFVKSSDINFNISDHDHGAIRNMNEKLKRLHEEIIKTVLPFFKIDPNSIQRELEFLNPQTDWLDWCELRTDTNSIKDKFGFLTPQDDSLGLAEENDFIKNLKRLQEVLNNALKEELRNLDSVPNRFFTSLTFSIFSKDRELHKVRYSIIPELERLNRDLPRLVKMIRSTDYSGLENSNIKVFDLLILVFWNIRLNLELGHYFNLVSNRDPETIAVAEIIYGKKGEMTLEELVEKLATLSPSIS